MGSTIAFLTWNSSTCGTSSFTTGRRLRGQCAAWPPSTRWLMRPPCSSALAWFSTGRPSTEPPCHAFNEITASDPSWLAGIVLWPGRLAGFVVPNLAGQPHPIGRCPERVNGRQPPHVRQPFLRQGRRLLPQRLLPDGL